MKKGLKLIGVLVLASVLFYSCDQKGATTTEVETSGDGVVAGDMKVAFVYTDSVINKYDYFKKMSEEITAKGQRFDTDLQSRARGFEQEVATFQQTGGNMTPNQARAKQDELVKKEQNLMTYRNNLMQELSADETKMMNDIYEQVQAYIKEYAAENKIDIILSYTRGGAMWYASDAMDVTASVIEGINKKYSSNTPTTTTTPADTTAKK